MFSILIVEDDPMIRRGLCRDFPWEKWGYAIAGDAPDGDSALEMALRLKPDCVLTDIRMPGLDGITLLQRLRALGNPPQVVLLSAYDDFRYAQKGINAGAFSYILKTEVFDELEGVMLKLSQRMREDRRMLDICGKWRKDELRGLLFSFDSGKALDERTSCAVMSCWGAGGECESTYDFDARVSSFHDGGVLFLVALSGSTEDLSALLKDIWHNSISRGVGAVGRVFTGCDCARRAVWDSVRLLDAARYLSAEGLITAHDRLVLPKCGNGASIGALSSDPDATYEYLRSCFLESITSCEFALESFRERCLEQIHHYEQLLPGGEPCEVSLAARERIAVCRCLFDMLNIARDCVSGLSEIASANELNRSRIAVKRAAAYLSEHLSEAVTVSELADMLGLSANYLSQRFHDETGSTYVNYVKSLRIETAKSLLTQTSLNLSEIARRTGFQSVRYFHRIFRAETGMTPGEYRLGAR